MKTKVDMLRTGSDAKQKLIGSFVCDSGKITFEPKENDIRVESLLGSDKSIRGKDGKKYSMNSDGEKFMDNLCVHFMGSHLRATQPKKV